MRDFSQQQTDPLLCYAVCALGAKYSDDGQQDASRFLFERCQSILNASRAPTTLSTVQVQPTALHDMLCIVYVN